VIVWLAWEEMVEEKRKRQGGGAEKF